ncbi:MAG TPA: hypothetical protein VGM75_25355 [Pseudonocardiaceae bacterium]|jgi:translation initiation factor IF-2
MSETTSGVATAASDRRSFVRAFVRGPHGQRKPGRLAMRPGALIAVVLAAALIAVAIGAIPALIHSGQSGVTPSANKPNVNPAKGVPALAGSTLSPNSGGVGSVGGVGQSTSSGSGGGPLASSGASGTGAGIGAGGGSGGPTAGRPAAPRPAAQTNNSAAVNQPTYSGIVGEGCANPNGRYGTSVTPGTSGWLKSSTGGFRASGCNGDYDSIPMRGSTSGWDQGAFAAYQWNFSSMFTAGTCHFAVYVPNNGPTFVGGNPAFYHFWASDSYNSKATNGFGQFTVNQLGNRGGWVNSPAFGVSSGHVALIVVNTGVDNQGQHVAAAPILLTCTKS